MLDMVGIFLLNLDSFFMLLTIHFYL